MIVSASRRTDIPAFFGRWFAARIREGYFCNANPFNRSQAKTYSLRPEDVDAIVFWSKNPAPFMGYLDMLDSLGYNYYFQFTLNDYPHVLEPGMPSLEERVETFMRLASRIGRERVIWRYDPVILSTVTPAEYHIERLKAMAAKLEGYCERLIISFLDFYGKAEKRLEEIARKEGMAFVDIAGEGMEDELLELARHIGYIGEKNGMKVYSCAEKADLSAVGIEHSSCIDAALINRLFGTGTAHTRDKNQRGECLCVASVDMGAYNTCSFGCAYCYANYSKRSVQDNLLRHDPESPFMLPPTR